MSAPLAIRPEEPGDGAAIRTIHERAFAQPGEADLVDALRRDGDLVLSLVASSDALLVGHIAFSRLAMPNAGLRGTALAPVAVLPEWQGRGIGAALVREGLRRLSSAGEDLVLVLGDPAYYGRFGFSAEAATGLRTPYDGPYQQALRLSDAGRAAGGVVTYAPAFSRLG